MSRRSLLLIPLVLVAALGAGGIAIGRMDVAAPLVRAAARATGREVGIGGLSWHVTPGGIEVAARDLTLANMPGGSRPFMLTAAAARAHIALWPLLSGRIQVTDLRLTRPGLLLETDAAGTGNWRFARPAPAAPRGSATPIAGPRFRLDLSAIEADDGTIGWRDGRTGASGAASLSHAALRLGASLTSVQAQARLGDREVTLSGEVGPLPVAAGAWPVNLSLHTPDAALDIRGAVTEPLRLRGFDLRLSGTAADAAALPHPGLSRALPALRDARIAAHWVDGQPIDVDLAATYADAAVTARGRAVPAERRFDGDVTARAADPGALLAALGLALPNQGPMTLSGTVSVTPASVAWRGLHLVLPSVDLSGDAVLDRAERPLLRATLTARALDVDALVAAWLHPRPPPAPPAVAPVAAPAAAPAPSPAATPWVIPDRKLSLAALGRADADIRIAARSARIAGGDYRDFTGHALLAGGVLTLDPLEASAPGGGRVTASLRLDSHAAPPTAMLTLHAPAVAVAPLLAGFGLPAEGAAGVARIDADLRAAGATWHAWAASLDGHAALSLADATLDGRLLGPLLARLPDRRWFGFLAKGQARVRCLALGLDAAGGVARVAPLVLDTPELLVTGGGAVDLGRETLDLRLRPLLRSGIGLTVPLRVVGPWRAVTVGPDGAVADPRSAGADACAAAGVAAAPPSPPAKRLKPADILRGLLR